MGGENSDQLVEFVRSYDPRGWSCLHITEGSLNCNNTIVQNNDIGPCGSDNFQECMSCRNSVVRNNMIEGATDGGIVVFGSPGTQIYNNTIWILNVRST
jgi:parallel beta-helix repeat protein